MVVGVVLVLIGAVLLFIPVEDQGSQTVDTSSTLPGELVSVSGFSLTGSIPVSIDWTATSAVVVAAVACSGNCESSNASTLSGVTTQTGTSGTITLNQPDGGEVGMIALPASGGHEANVTFDIKTALTSVGSILIVLGIVLLIVGVVLQGKPKAGAAPVAPAYAPDGGTMDPPPPTS
jgi:uncharacterized membrane protein